MHRKVAVAALLVPHLAAAGPREPLPAGAVLDRAGTHAYVAADDGVDELDVATGARRRVYTTPDTPPDFCVVMIQGRPSPALIDVVVGLADGDRTLVLDRHGVGCHVPDHERIRVVDFRDPTRARVHAERPIHAIAAGAGVVWFTDGDGLWRSDDRGDTWTAADPDPDATPPGAPDAIVADATRPGLLVATTVWLDDGLTIAPGPLARTRDGGRTWARVALPGDRDDAPVAVAWVASSDGNADHLDVGVDGVPARAWRTRDGGRSWRAIHARRPAPVPAVVLGDDLFVATDDGVVRTRAGVHARVTPELAREPLRDRVGLAP
jgi:hypothetical protein